jgi:hypothetical protein
MESNLIDILKYSFVHTFICIVLYETNVIFEYFKYSSVLCKIFKINDYIKYKELTKSEDLYIQYISNLYNNFFIKLISCPLCLGFWVNLIISYIINDLSLFFALYCLSVMLYGVYKLIWK